MGKDLPPIRTGISYMYEAPFNRAILPLLEAGEVDALEWSFDTVRDHRTLPHWISSLLKAYAQESRLYAHGVHYSLFTGLWTQTHIDWLGRLEDTLQTFQFQHITEHFGFLTTHNAHGGAPLPVPLCKEMLQLGTSRLQKLQQVTGLHVGIENLALSFCLDDVVQQSAFLAQLAEPVNGFILLDLHNVYCQAINFGVDARQLIAAYPLHLVKEIHVAGGSWETSKISGTRIRRDTHDQPMPQEVTALLEYTVGLCPNLELVIIERLGDSLHTQQDEALLREEFLTIKAIVNKTRRPAANAPYPFPAAKTGTFSSLENRNIAQQQTAILHILKNSRNAQEAHTALLQCADIDNALWNIAGWQLPMIETAMRLGEKWGIDA